MEILKQSVRAIAIILRGILKIGGEFFSAAYVRGRMIDKSAEEISVLIQAFFKVFASFAGGGDVKFVHILAGKDNAGGL